MDLPAEFWPTITLRSERAMSIDSKLLKLIARTFLIIFRTINRQGIKIIVDFAERVRIVHSIFGMLNFI